MPVRVARWLPAAPPVIQLSPSTIMTPEARPVSRRGSKSSVISVVMHEAMVASASRIRLPLSSTPISTRRHSAGERKEEIIMPAGGRAASRPTYSGAICCCASSRLINGTV